MDHYTGRSQGHGKWIGRLRRIHLIKWSWNDLKGHRQGQTQDHHQIVGQSPTFYVLQFPLNCILGEFFRVLHTFWTPVILSYNGSKWSKIVILKDYLKFSHWLVCFVSPVRYIYPVPASGGAGGGRGFVLSSTVFRSLCW